MSQAYHLKCFGFVAPAPDTNSLAFVVQQEKQVCLPRVFNAALFLLQTGGGGGGGAEVSTTIPRPSELFYSKLTPMLKDLYKDKLDQVRTFFNQPFRHQIA